MSPAYNHRLGRAVLTFALGTSLVLAGCGPTVRAKPEAPQDAALVWPAPPAQARIRWLKTISSPEDLGVRPSIFRRAWNWASGRNMPHLVRPHATSVDRSGRLWVTDPGAQRVYVFDFDKRSYLELPKHAQDAPVSPIGITHDDVGTAYVSDSARAVILRFDPNGRMLPSWNAAGELHRPTGLAYAPETGLLWIVDTTTHRLVALDKLGTVRRIVGGRGEQLGRFNFPTHIATDKSGRLYVADTLNFRIQVLSGQGEPLASMGSAGDGPGSLSRPKGIGVDEDGHVYVVDALFENVQIFDTEGRLLLYFGEPGSKPGRFWLPAGLFADGRRIYVADAYNRRVQVFEYLGG